MLQEGVFFFSKNPSFLHVAVGFVDTNDRILPVRCPSSSGQMGSSGMVMQAIKSLHPIVT